MNTEIFWHQVADRLAAGRKVFVSTVAANTHGSPGTLGAHLLVDANGEAAGTIGGGIMEAQLIEEARRRLQDDAASQPELRLLVHRKDASTHASGLICAGQQTNVSIILDPRQHGAAIRRFSAAISARDAAVLTIDADGISVAAADADAAPGPALVEDGDGWQYRESSIGARPMAIVGGGHCGKALARLAMDIGYQVDVFDDRDGVLAPADWPPQVRLHTLPDYGRLATQLRYPQRTTVVVMTASVLHDIAALASVAGRELAWLGVMGSAAKIHEIRTQLAARGIDQKTIDTISGPIGLPMKSDKPPEIAVSIMAQLLAEQRPDPRAGSRTRAQQRRPAG